MSHGNFISWRSTYRGISSFVVLHVAWHFTHSNLVVLHMGFPSRNPVACKSMVTRQIFKSYTLTFACDTCKLTHVCEVIVELYRKRKAWLVESLWLFECLYLQMM